MDKKSFFDRFKKNLPEGPVKIEKSAKAPLREASVKKGGIPDMARLQMQAQQGRSTRPPELPQQKPPAVEQAPAAVEHAPSAFEQTPAAVEHAPVAFEQAPPALEQTHFQAEKPVNAGAPQFTILDGISDGAADDFPDSAEVHHRPPPPLPPKQVVQNATPSSPPPIAPMKRNSPQEVAPPVIPARRASGKSRIPPRQEEKKSTPVWVFSLAGLAAAILIVWGVCTAIQKAKSVPVHLSLAYSDGEPYLIKKGSKHNAVLLPNGLIRVGNIVETSNFPRTIIQIEKDNYFIAGPNTRFTVLGMRKVQDMKDIVLKLKLEKGRLWIDHPKWLRVTVETPMVLVEPEVGSTEIKVVDKGDVKVLSWRGEANYRPFVGKERQPHPDQVINIGERETSTMTAEKVISPAQSINVRAMDAWEAWNLGIKLPEVVEGELLDPDTAFKNMQKQGFAYTKMYYGQPEPEPEPNQAQANQEEQGDVNEVPAGGGDIAMNSSGGEGMSPGGNKGSQSGGMRQGGYQGSGMQQGGRQGGNMQGGLKGSGMQQQGNHQGGGFSQSGYQGGGMQQGGFQGSGSQQGGYQVGGMQQGSYQGGGFSQGGYQGGGFSQGGSSSQVAFDSAWQGGTLSQSGGMNKSYGGKVAWNQKGSSKKNAYPTASSGKGNRQGGYQSGGFSQGGQAQPPQLPGGNSTQFQKYQKKDNKPSQQSGDSASQSGGPGGGGGQKMPVPVSEPMKEVKAPRGYSGGEQDTVSKKDLPGYALGGNPVTDVIGNNKAGAYRAAPPGYTTGEAPIAGDASGEWVHGSSTSSGGDLWYRITNSMGAASSQGGSRGT